MSEVQRRVPPRQSGAGAGDRPGRPPASRRGGEKTDGVRPRDRRPPQASADRRPAARRLHRETSRGQTPEPSREWADDDWEDWDEPAPALPARTARSRSSRSAATVVPPRRERTRSAPRREPAEISTALPDPRKRKRSKLRDQGGALAGGAGTLLFCCVLLFKVWVRYERAQRRSEDRATARAAEAQPQFRLSDRPQPQAVVEPERNLYSDPFGDRPHGTTIGRVTTLSPPALSPPAVMPPVPFANDQYTSLRDDPFLDPKGTGGPMNGTAPPSFRSGRFGGATSRPLYGAPPGF